MKQHELDEIQAMADALKDSKIAKHTDKQLAHYATYAGRKFSDAHREKLRQANLGRIMSDESKAKAIAARTGKKQNISKKVNVNVLILLLLLLISMTYKVNYLLLTNL